MRAYRVADGGGYILRVCVMDGYPPDTHTHCIEHAHTHTHISLSMYPRLSQLCELSRCDDGYIGSPGVETFCMQVLMALLMH